MTYFKKALTALSIFLPTLAIAQTPYPINFDKNQDNIYQGNAGERRFISQLSWKTTEGTQLMNVYNMSKAYTDLTTKTFSAKAGETVIVGMGFSTEWMHGYVYLDQNHDGNFSSTVLNGYDSQGSDLLAFSYYKAYNSTGVASNQRTVDPPALTIPAHLASGFYRLRFKVDWDNIDPAGAISTNDGTATGKNGIIANGGAIVDTRLNVHNGTSTITLQCGETQPTVTTAPIGKDFPLDLTTKIPEGKSLLSITVRHGHYLDKPANHLGTTQWVEETIPSFLLQSGKAVIPAAMIDGDAIITVAFGEKANSENGEYHRNVTTTATQPKNGAPTLRSITATAAMGGKSEIKFTAAQNRNIVIDLSQAYTQQLSVLPGDAVSLSIDGVKYSDLHAYLFLDQNQDGIFTPSLDSEGKPHVGSELVSYDYYNGKNAAGQSATSSVGFGSLPTFTIHPLLPEGTYRARLVVQRNSIDSEGNYSAASSEDELLQTGGFMVDFLVNVHAPTATIDVVTEHSNVYSKNRALPAAVPAFEPNAFQAVPANDGYDCIEYTAKVGHNLNGPQFINGNRQWEVVTLNRSGWLKLTRTQVVGNILLTARFAPGANATYLPALTEEFNDNASEPNAKFWKRSTRYGSTWNRWISNADEVVEVKDGKLICRAIPTPAHVKAAGETEPMITGSIESQNLFAFQYGKVEGRIKTNPYKGNFPAFWMMPNKTEKGWPNDGEIDIWEQIDAQNASIHTIHTHWTYDLGNKQNPLYSTTQPNVDMSIYHIYGVEWTPTSIVWTVDGEVVHSYNKSNNADALENGQWPFDRPFYLILNQSVGNGSWAQPADVTHTYETLFDWIRVYQTKEQNPQVGIGQVLNNSRRNLDNNYYDLSGRQVIHPQQGVFIRHGKKVIMP